MIAMPPFHVVIPARYASGRLPGKPLMDIHGKPMIQRVVEAAADSAASTVTVATDDQRIHDAVLAFGGQAVMTRADHASGSDRIAEACVALGLTDNEIVVNLQGDEPLMPPPLVDQVARLLSGNPVASMATLCTGVDDEALLDPAVVKVVTDQRGLALYFSRAPIPWVRDAESSAMAEGAAQHARRHLGIYAYRSGYIRQFSARPPSALEQLERLEQLRALSHGESIVCADAVTLPGPGVDNAADLEEVRRLMAAFDR